MVTAPTLVRCCYCYYYEILIIYFCIEFYRDNISVETRSHILFVSSGVVLVLHFKKSTS